MGYSPCLVFLCTQDIAFSNLTTRAILYPYHFAQRDLEKASCVTYAELINGFAAPSFQIENGSFTIIKIPTCVAPLSLLRPLIHQITRVASTPLPLRLIVINTKIPRPSAVAASLPPSPASSSVKHTLPPHTHTPDSANTQPHNPPSAPQTPQYPSPPAPQSDAGPPTSPTQTSSTPRTSG